MKRTFAEDDLAPRRHRHDDLRRKRVFPGFGHTRADPIGDVFSATAIDVVELHLAAARDERPRRRFAVHARADHRRSPVASQRLGREDRRSARAQRGHRRSVERRFEPAVRRVGEQHEPGDCGQPVLRIPRERRHPFQQRVARS